MDAGHASCWRLQGCSCFLDLPVISLVSSKEMSSSPLLPPPLYNLNKGQETCCSKSD